MLTTRPTIDRDKGHREPGWNLIKFEQERNICVFEITKRIFIIHGKKNVFRGNHAHYKCYQFLVPLSGSMIVYYEYKKRKNVKTLSFNLNNSLLMKPMTWCKIKFLSNNSKLVVFCDREYEAKDYINDYNIYLNLLKKK